MECLVKELGQFIAQDFNVSVHVLCVDQPVREYTETFMDPQSKHLITSIDGEFIRSQKTLVDLDKYTRVNGQNLAYVG